MVYNLSRRNSQRRYDNKYKEAIKIKRKKYYAENKDAIIERSKKCLHKLSKEEEEYIKSKYSFCFNKE